MFSCPTATIRYIETPHTCKIPIVNTQPIRIRKNQNKECNPYSSNLTTYERARRLSEDEMTISENIECSREICLARQINDPTIINTPPSEFMTSLKERLCVYFCDNKLNSK
jgi:hypothetical protein